MQRQDKEYVHGQLGVEAARIRGIFPERDEEWIVGEEKDVKKAVEEVDDILGSWRSEMERLSSTINNDELTIDSHETGHQSEVIPISDLWESDSGEHMDVDDENARFQLMEEITSLNEEQRRAYDIVDWHLEETMAGKKPPQLLMMIPGEGGVGKSKLIQTITRNFGYHGTGNWLVKGAYTGIAASLVDGKTLHVLGGIPVKGGKQSGQTLKKLREYWQNKRYLFIDEVSMLSRSFLSKLCRIISSAMEDEDENVFGGINVILVGDFHQFPPVVARRSAPLYWPADPRNDSEEDIFGRKIYEQFTTVVQLHQQIRVRDPKWHDLLQHVRYGNCLQHHIDTLKKLIITNPDCPMTDYNSPPWNDTKLVTPRHSVRLQWNSAAIRKYCAKTNHRLYLCPAQDTIDRRPVTNEEKIAILTRTKGSHSQMDRAGLMKETELAIGAQVMVTLNIHTDLDVANGVRGVVEGIVLDERERQVGVSGEHCTHLQYPPRYVLVKLNRTKAHHLHDLPDNVVPIEPVTKSFNIMKDGNKITVNRTQLPLTLAYAFTDYRAQGQTIELVVVDIGPPPHGCLTPFNIYVALSRATGLDNIRLLRDFDQRLFQQHPSEFLRMEDERLWKLNESTKCFFH